MAAFLSHLSASTASPHPNLQVLSVLTPSLFWASEGGMEKEAPPAVMLALLDCFKNNVKIILSGSLVNWLAMLDLSGNCTLSAGPVPRLYHLPLERVACNPSQFVVLLSSAFCSLWTFEQRLFCDEIEMSSDQTHTRIYRYGACIQICLHEGRGKRHASFLFCRGCSVEAKWPCPHLD